MDRERVRFWKILVKVGSNPGKIHSRSVNVGGVCNSFDFFGVFGLYLSEYLVSIASIFDTKAFGQKVFDVLPAVAWLIW